MKRLMIKRDIQRELMTRVALLVAIIMYYGGHVLIENPTHSKFWKEDFVKEICTIIRVKHPARARTFLLNRCMVDGVHFENSKNS